MYNNAQYEQIEDYYKHPDFINSTSLKNDIALIKLRLPLYFNESVQPACLGTQDSELYDGILKVGKNESDFGEFHLPIFHSNFEILISEIFDSDLRMGVRRLFPVAFRWLNFRI